MIIKKILVPVDGSDNADKAIEFAANLAEKDDARVHLIYVVKPVAYPGDYVAMAPHTSSTDATSPGQIDRSEDIGKHIILAAETKAREKGVNNIESTTIKGDPSEEILRYAKDADVDIIVMGSRGLGTFKALLLGSVSSKVSRRANRTCVIVR